METRDSEKKRVFLIETIKPRWIKRPKSTWPDRRFLVCHIDDATARVEAISNLVDEDAAFVFANRQTFEMVDDPSKVQFSTSDLLEGDPDFAVEITQAVMRELGIAIVEVVLYGKNGLPAKKQLAAKFWVLSVAGNAVQSVHVTLRHAYAEVSKQYEDALIARLIRSARPTP